MGEGVVRLKAGTRVALEPGIPCWGSTMARCHTTCLTPSPVLVDAAKRISCQVVHLDLQAGPVQPLSRREIFCDAARPW